MNRLLPTLALLLSICALVVALLLWREVHSLRMEASSRPIRTRISDPQFAVVTGLADQTQARFVGGTVPRSEVLKMERLLDKARYLHGDISREEWHRHSAAANPELPELVVKRLNVGAGSLDEMALYYDDLLESSY